MINLVSSLPSWKNQDKEGVSAKHEERNQNAVSAARLLSRIPTGFLGFMCRFSNVSMCFAQRMFWVRLVFLAGMGLWPLPVTLKSFEPDQDLWVSLVQSWLPPQDFKLSTNKGPTATPSLLPSCSMLEVTGRRIQAFLRLICGEGKLCLHSFGWFCVCRLFQFPLIGWHACGKALLDQPVRYNFWLPNWWLECQFAAIIVFRIVWVFPDCKFRLQVESA